MLNLDLTITLPLFFLFLSPLLPPTGDCKSFCFSQVLSSLILLLTWHTSIAICWVSAELPAILLTYSHHTHTHYPEAVTQISHSSSVYARSRHWNYHPRAYSNNKCPNQVPLCQKHQTETEWLLARNSTFGNFILFTILNIWDKPTKTQLFF